MATATDASPLLRARSDGARGKTVAGVVAALGVATLVALGASTTTRSTLRRATKDWFPNDGVLLAPAPSDLSPTVTFTLRTACKTTQLAEDRAAFFMDGEKEAYVVRHNYGTGEFFKNATKGPGKALKMERVTLDGEERGYRLTTNEVNFEFGFAIRNVETGEWLYEIGKSDSPLGKEKCTQKYGEYFNRALTKESDASRVEYVFGSCNNTCGATADTAYTSNFAIGVPPAHPSASMVLGNKGSLGDARLVTLRSGVLVESASGPLGRALISRDTRFAASRDQARFIMHGFSPYPYSDLRMVGLHVQREPNGDLTVSNLGGRIHSLSANCMGKQCMSGAYDVPALYHDDSTSRSGMNVADIEYTIAQMGDSRGEERSLTFPGNELLSTSTMVTSSEWGDDVDVRRIVLVSAFPCAGKCHRTLAITPDPTSTATASEKYWLLGYFAGGGTEGSPYVNMIRLRVYLDDDDNAQVTVDGASKGWCGLTGTEVNRGRFRNYDMFKTPQAISELYFEKDQFPVSHDVTQSGLGVGMLNYMLAPEMLTSLTGTVEYRIPAI